MTVVLVHGVPETTAVWDLIEPDIDAPVVNLGLPGFGNQRPEGFGSTMDEYVDWLEAEVGRIDGPVDLVGHDWGGILTARLVTTKPGLVRSWVSDAVGVLDPGFQWHDFAKIWQTPGEGEKFWEDLRADVAAGAAVLASLGVPEAQAAKFSAALDEEMSDSILKLYRSAVDIPGTWGAGSIPTEPGLVVVGGSDPFVSAEGARKIGEHLGAQVEILEAGGHWWPLDAASEATSAMKGFWASLPA